MLIYMIDGGDPHKRRVQSVFSGVMTYAVLFSGPRGTTRAFIRPRGLLQVDAYAEPAAGYS
jgi:hypothetical protein